MGVIKLIIHSPNFNQEALITYHSVLNVSQLIHVSKSVFGISYHMCYKPSL